jgi:hypothetical protein
LSPVDQDTSLTPDSSPPKAKDPPDTESLPTKDPLSKTDLHSPVKKTPPLPPVDQDANLTPDASPPKAKDPPDLTAKSSLTKDPLSKTDLHSPVKKTPPLPPVDQDVLNTPDLSLPKTKDLPDLKAAIPKKKSKKNKALPENKADDPLSRIHPSKPLVPLAGSSKQPQDDGESGTEEEKDESKQPPTGKSKGLPPAAKKLQAEDNEAEEDSKMPPTTGKGETQLLKGTTRLEKERLLKKRKAATEASALEIARLKKRLIDNLSDTESELEDYFVNSQVASQATKTKAKDAIRSAAKKKAKEERLIEERQEAQIEKEREIARLLKTPVVSGPPKSQAVITHFFLRETHLARQKLEESSERRRQRGPDWWSQKKKSPAELKIARADIKRKHAETKAAAAVERERKAVEKRAEVTRRERQDDRDKKAARLLYNKYYKDEFQRKESGKNAKILKVKRMTEQMEDDFAIPPILTAEEEKEWEEVSRLAAEGDKVRKSEVKEFTLVKELTQLMYVPTVWQDKDGENEEGEEEDTADQNKKARQPSVKAHFLGFSYDVEKKQSNKTEPLNPEWVRRFFKGVYVNLVMLKPNHWWPCVAGHARPQDDFAPKDLLVSGVPVFFSAV